MVLLLTPQRRAPPGVRGVRARRERQARLLQHLLRHGEFLIKASGHDGSRRQHARAPQETLARAVVVRRRVRRVRQVRAEDGTTAATAAGVADDEHIPRALAALRVLPAVLVERGQRRAVPVQAVRETPGVDELEPGRDEQADLLRQGAREELVLRDALEGQGRERRGLERRGRALGRVYLRSRSGIAELVLLLLLLLLLGRSAAGRRLRQTTVQAGDDMRDGVGEVRSGGLGARQVRRRRW